MEKKNYIQCQLRKDGISQILWIEDKYVVKDNILNIKLNGVWNEGWKVISSGGKLDGQTLLHVLHLSFTEAILNEGK